MRRPSNELWYALAAIVLITAGYIFLTWHQGTIPNSSGLSGHLLGVAGFILMLMTEVLYSVRKRSRRTANLGSMETWLKFHVFTGIVGPYMVLLHTAWRFNGLAGMVTWLTVVIVFSGFIGRYIYTAIPRSAGGVELDSSDLESLVAKTDKELQDWIAANPGLSKEIPQDIMSLPRISYNVWPIVFGRIFLEWGFRLRWGRVRRRLKKIAWIKLIYPGKLLIRRRQLHYQKASLVLERRIMATWHSVHIPLGIALFTTAFIHVGVAIYYVTLAR